MVKIPQKLAYACQVMVRLAICDDGEKVTRLDDLAKAEGLSPNFLVQILNDLRRAGLVLSRRGKAGGYLLGRPAGEINLKEITLAIEGSIFDPSEMSIEGSGPEIKRAWQELSEDFSAKLEGRKLADLLPGEEAPMYYI